MATPKTPLTLTYRHTGTQPPIFVAGEFSDPPWEPQEMDYTTDEDGEHTFKKQIYAPAGSKVQYKFRVGTGDWWVLNEDTPTAVDAGGFLNNVVEVPSAAEPSAPAAVAGLAKHTANGDASSGGDRNNGESMPTREGDSQVQEVPSIANAAKEIMHRIDPRSTSGASTPSFVKTAAEVADSAALLDKEDEEPEVTDEEAGRTGFRRMSATPIHDVAKTAAEVADTAQDLDSDNITQLEVRPAEYNTVDPYGFDEPSASENKAPLFAHECVGMELYEGEDAPEPPGDEGYSAEYEYDRRPSTVYDEEENIDVNDPTLERFPSNREEIIDTVRKLEGGLNEDHADVHGLVPLSPVVGPSGPQNYDLVGDILVSSPVVASPVVARGSRLLGLPRPSLGSVSSDFSSALSLDSISEAEEAGVEDEVNEPPTIMTPQPRRLSSKDEMKPAISEDEGIVMKTGSDKNQKARGVSSGEDTHVLTPGVDGPTKAPLSEIQAEEDSRDSVSPQPAQLGIKLDPASANSASQTSVPSGRGNEESGSPRIVIQTAEETERAEGNALETGTELSASNNAEATGVDNAAQSQLKRRVAPPDRVATPTSINETGIQAAKSGNWFRSFFRMIFLDWIGGFISRLCGGKRKTLFAAGATALLVGAAWWKNTSN